MATLPYKDDQASHSNIPAEDFKYKPKTHSPASQKNHSSFPLQNSLLDLCSPKENLCTKKRENASLKISCSLNFLQQLQVLIKFS